MVKLKKFCFLFDLETGGIIMGWFGVVFGFAAFTAIVTMFSMDVEPWNGKLSHLSLIRKFSNVVIICRYLA